MSGNQGQGTPTTPPVPANGGNTGASAEPKTKPEGQGTPPVVPPVAPAEPPAWSKGGKYKSPEDVAHALDAAVREMKLKEQEAAIARKELELERQARGQQPAASPAQPQPAVTEDFKKQLEETYGIPYGQIAAMNDLLELKLSPTIQQAISPLAENIYGDKFSTIKQNVLEKDEIYVNYRPEFEARLNRLPVNKRVDMAEINKIRSEIVNENLPAILEKARQDAVASLRPTPVPAPDVSQGSATVDDTPKPVLTKEQRLAAERMGYNPDDVEKWVSRKQERQSGWLNHTK